MEAFLIGLISKIVRPIIQEELQELKNWAFDQSIQLERFRQYDKTASKHIEQIEKASTPEEVKAHLRRMYADRAKLNL